MSPQSCQGLYHCPLLQTLVYLVPPIPACWRRRWDTWCLLFQPWNLFASQQGHTGYSVRNFISLPDSYPIPGFTSPRRLLTLPPLVTGTGITRALSPCPCVMSSLSLLPSVGEGTSLKFYSSLLPGFHSFFNLPLLGMWSQATFSEWVRGCGWFWENMPCAGAEARTGSPSSVPAGPHSSCLFPIPGDVGIHFDFQVLCDFS